MTQREDVMRAALERLDAYFVDPPDHDKYEYHACYLPRVIVEEALAEVGALPENDTEDLRPALEQMRKAAEAGYVTGERWKARAKAAEARLAQLAELSECVRLNIKRDYLSAAEGQITRIQRIARGGESA